jgi:hypothetical protein
MNLAMCGVSKWRPSAASSSHSSKMKKVLGSSRSA